jgi:hypothetical protein
MPKDGTSVHDSLLLIFADALDDLERVRIATENRVRALRQVKGMDGTPEERRLDALVVGLAALEHGAELDLKRALRAHPFGPWVKAQVGIGEKQGARLLAATGDPYMRPARIDRDSGEIIEPERPRTVSQLWAYCGLHVLHPSHLAIGTRHSSAGVDFSTRTDHVRHAAHHAGVGAGELASDPGHGSGDDQCTSAGVAPKRRKGQKANWNTEAKMRAYLVATSCIKQMHSPYRPTYENRRGHTAETHPDWSDGHSHNDALRIVAKAILRDLWIEGRRLAMVGTEPTLRPRADDSRNEQAA